MANKPYDVLIAEEYTNSNGEVKTKFYTVGVAFERKNGEGMSLEIASGISITGRAVIMPRKARETSAEDEQ